MMASTPADAEVTESSLPYVNLNRKNFLTHREMINELNSVLVPDEEVARIQEAKTLIKEIQSRRQEERKALLEVIQGM